jgi:hypothetical protein
MVSSVTNTNVSPQMARNNSPALPPEARTISMLRK